MHFDDSLDTVLAAEMAGSAGVAAAWRQLVDLTGRRRGGAHDDALARLAAIRLQVPLAVRIASAHELARADPPVGLVALFADDDPAVAAPVVRQAQLRNSDWIALIPSLRPPVRNLLRERRDLDPEVGRALAQFGPSDLVLPAAPPATPPAASDDDFAIGELMKRIERHRRGPGDAARIATAPPVAMPPSFRYETDAAGRIRWCDALVREPIIGLVIAAPGTDAAIAAAFSRRQRFAEARVTVAGTSPVGGLWLLSGVPAFERASGRFTGYRGTARRPRLDEVPAPAPDRGDALRQLLHELRTPANAISGFAEMIEHQLLGPIDRTYRDYAITIRAQAARLLEAIDDLDMAARVEAQRLERFVEPVAMVDLLQGVMRDLAALADLRGARLTLDVGRELVVHGDRRTLERLFARLLGALLACAASGEVLSGDVASDGYIMLCRISVPAAFQAGEGALLDADARDGEEPVAEGGSLLGSAFAYRLARALAAELGGTIAVSAGSLTLRLPAAVDAEVGQAAN